MRCSLPRGDMSAKQAGFTASKKRTDTRCLSHRDVCHLGEVAGILSLAIVIFFSTFEPMVGLLMGFSGLQRSEKKQNSLL